MGTFLARHASSCHQAEDVICLWRKTHTDLVLALLWAKPHTGIIGGVCLQPRLPMLSLSSPGPPLTRLVSCMAIKATGMLLILQCRALLRCRLLALCAHLAAGLPYRRADEAHTVVYHVNVLVSRRGEDVRSTLKLSLDDRLPDSNSPGQDARVHIRTVFMVMCQTSSQHAEKSSSRAFSPILKA